MTINHYYINRKEYAKMPDPCNGVSPMYKKDGTPNDALFIQLGGEIRPAEHLTENERVCVAFGDLIADLATMTDRITPAEFLAAARNGISADLIALAHVREVPEDVIQYARARIIELMADALRFGVTWAELIAFAEKGGGLI